MKSKWTALALLAATQFVLILDLMIVSVAMPPMARELHLTASDLSWMSSAYSLVFGGLLLLGGRLSDYLGRRRMFALGMVVFALASLAGGLAGSGGMLVAARAVQGLGGAIVAPAALSLVMSIFKDDPAMPRAMGVWGAVGAVGASVGVVVGGVLTDGLGWRSVFYVNVPIGLAAAALAVVLLPATPVARASRGFDVLGAITSTGGLALLIYAFVDTDPLLVVGAVVLLGAFLVIEKRSASPLMPLGIFRNRGLRASNVVMFLVAGAMQPVAFILTLYTQQILGYDATQSGLSVVAISVAIALTASTLGGRILARYGARTTIAAGLVLILVAVPMYLRLGVDSGFVSHLLLPEILSGIGFGLLVGAVTMTATSSVPAAESGLASGLFNVTQQVGISIGIAAQIALATAVAGSTSPQALLAGYHVSFLVSAALVAAALVTTLVMLPKRTREPLAQSQPA
ncbi:MAG: MFS transporter [Nonomuraea sp.]|nr:MFS transporter [Nonomuraea sp.]